MALQLRAFFSDVNIIDATEVNVRYGGYLVLTDKIGQTDLLANFLFIVREVIALVTCSSTPMMIWRIELRHDNRTCLRKWTRCIRGTHTYIQHALTHEQITKMGPCEARRGGADVATFPRISSLNQNCCTNRAWVSSSALVSLRSDRDLARCVKHKKRNNKIQR